MNLVLTMAGKYQRFRDEGYVIPKYLLPWGRRSILGELLQTLSIDNTIENIYLVANKADSIYMPHVIDIMRSLDIPEENLFVISDTSSQAETAERSISLIQGKNGLMQGSLIFHNIDTLLYGRDFKDIDISLRTNQGYIDTFISSNHAYSYVLSTNSLVERVAEKVVISDQATSGLYAFDSVKTFLYYYKEGDEYIIETYKRMIDQGLRVKAGRAFHNDNDTIVLGTPEQYIDNTRLLSKKEN